MVHIRRAHSLRRQLRVSHEPRRRVNKRPRFPGVIRRLAGDQHLGSLRSELLRRILEIRREGQHCLRDAVVRGAACLAARSWAVRPPIVRCRERAAVVVPEFNHYPVAGLDDVGDGVEAALACVGAGAPACDGFVRNRQAGVGGDVAAPSCVLLGGLGICKRGDRVPAVPEPVPLAAMVESPAR